MLETTDVQVTLRHIRVIKALRRGQVELRRLAGMADAKWRLALALSEIEASLARAAPEMARK